MGLWFCLAHCDLDFSQNSIYHLTTVRPYWPFWLPGINDNSKPVSSDLQRGWGCPFIQDTATLVNGCRALGGELGRFILHAYGSLQDPISEGPRLQLSQRALRLWTALSPETGWGLWPLSWELRVPALLIKKYFIGCSSILFLGTPWSIGHPQNPNRSKHSDCRSPMSMMFWSLNAAL